MHTNRRPTTDQALRNAIAQGLVDPADGQYLFEFLERYSTLKNLSRGSRLKYGFSVLRLLEMLSLRGVCLRDLTEDGVLRLVSAQTMAEGGAHDIYVPAQISAYVNQRWGGVSG